MWSDVQRLEHTFYSSDCVFPVNFWTSDKSGHSTTKFNFARGKKKRICNNIWTEVSIIGYTLNSKSSLSLHFFFPKLEYLMAIDIILCIKFSSPNFLAYDLIYFYTYIHINPRKYYCGYFYYKYKYWITFWIFLSSWPMWYLVKMNCMGKLCITQRPTC